LTRSTEWITAEVATVYSLYWLLCTTKCIMLTGTCCRTLGAWMWSSGLVASHTWKTHRASAVCLHKRSPVRLLSPGLYRY